MELYKNVHQIQSLYHERNLFQYLFAGSKILLVDTGIAETPNKVILPYLDGLKIRPQQLSLVVVTHADLDHQGGNDAIKDASPHTWLSCGAADQQMIEDPHALYKLRYNFLAEAHGIGFDSVPSPQAGRARRIDLCFSGGERIRLDKDWELEVLHVPGHSYGHLALYDRKHKAAFVGDAIHGRGCPKAAGGIAIPVTYYYVDIYLSTLRYFESLPIDVLYSGHWPTMRGDEIRDFIAESRQTVELLDRTILSALDRQASALTLKELIDTASNAVGDWPKEHCQLAMFPVKGHMDRLEQQGKVRALRGARPVKWTRA